MNIKVVIALNMYDELEQKGARLDHKLLGEMMGIPIVPTVASKGKGLKELFDRIIEVYEDRDPIVRHIHINYGGEIEKSICNIQLELKKDDRLRHKYSTRFLAIKLLEGDKHTLNLLNDSFICGAVSKIANEEVLRLEKLFDDQSETLIADAKYGFVAGALKETYRNGVQVRRDQSREI